MVVYEDRKCDYTTLQYAVSSTMSGLADSFTENDEAIKHLLRQVVYMFYPHQSIIILEAILFHNVLFEDDLIKLCCMHKKVFRSFCNKLIDDKLIVSHIQKEEAQPFKLFTRTYYYVHNIEAIDSIKWKIHTIVKKVKEEIGNFSEPQGYICPTCHTKYTLLDAASLLTDDKLNFECSICNDHLIDDDISQEQRKGQEKLEKLMSLVEPIIQYLKIVDDLKIDDNNFESTLMKYIPAFSDSLALYSISNKTSVNRKKKSENGSEISDVNKKSQATIHVSITADDEDLKRERQKREDRNRKLRQNALPSWHQESTVGKLALGRLDSDDDNENENENITDATSVQPEDNLTEATTLLNNSTSQVNVKSDSTNDHTGTTINTNPLANVSLDANSISISNPSVSATARSPSLNSTLSTVSTIPNIPSVSEGTTTEELDALSAYYSQLRQRQAIEEQEEEDEDEEEEEGENIDIDDEDIELGDGFDDADEGDEENNNNDNTIQHSSTEPEPSKEASGSKDDSLIKEDLDEDDFDLDMFADE